MSHSAPIEFSREAPSSETIGTREMSPVAEPGRNTLRPTVGVSFGKAMASSNTMLIVNAAHQVRLPQKWSDIPRWSDLVRAEIGRIQIQEGDRAFEDLCKATGNPNGRGALLKRRYKAGGAAEIQLTSESEWDLKRRVGLS